MADWTGQLDSWREKSAPDLRIASEELMSRHTSFRTGGAARRMAFPETPEQMERLLNFTLQEDIPVLVIGNGSNLLAPDKGLNQLVICTCGMNQLSCNRPDNSADRSSPGQSSSGDSGGVLTANAGATLTRTAELACQTGWTGLEFAHGIPGTVGGGVYMNAGAYGGEMAQVIRSVRVWLPQKGVREYTREAMCFSYRHSVLMEQEKAVLLSADFQLSAGDPEAIRRTMRELLQRRKASQPLDRPSAGSTFKRPPGYFAGTLIDQCGLRGLTYGGAQVSEKHAGFIINLGNASSADILALIRQVQERVFAETGVTLEPEVKLLSSDCCDRFPGRDLGF